VTDPSFVLDISRINTNLPVARIFLNSIQEDSRDTPYPSPGTLPPSYSSIYEVEPDLIEVDPPSDPQLHSPPPSPLNEPPSDSLPSSFLTLPPPLSLLFPSPFLHQS